MQRAGMVRERGARLVAAALVAAIVIVLGAGARPASAVFSDGPSGIDYTKWHLRVLKPFDGTPLDGTDLAHGGWSRDGSKWRVNVRRDERNEYLDTIYQVDADTGANLECVTCGLEIHFRIENQGVAPHGSESTDGEWLIGYSFGPIVSPGQGIGIPGPYNSFGSVGQIVDSDVWALRLDRKNGIAVAAYNLTEGPIERADLQPAFTPDGSQIVWWRHGAIQGESPDDLKRSQIMRADFVVENGVPHLENEEVFVHAGDEFLEDGGFSEDGTRYYFMKTVHGDPELFARDVATGEDTRLTDHVGWDEFPHPSPNGEVVYFMSDRAYSNPVCDPMWDGRRVADAPVQVDYLAVVAGAPVCTAGEVKAPEGEVALNQDRIPEVGTKFDPWLMTPAGDKKGLLRLNDGGGSLVASWSPDSRELALQAPGFAEVENDEVPILVFGSD